MVHATLGHLRKAFLRQRQPTLLQAQCKNLLLFYAVECGLKAAWLNRNRLRDTAEIEPLLKQRGHDLVFWTKALYLPATITNGNAGFRLRSGKIRLDLESAHQAWRYGTDMEPVDEVALVTWLERVWDWARAELQL
jgi:hypothetical protein